LKRSAQASIRFSQTAREVDVHLKKIVLLSLVFPFLCDPHAKEAHAISLWKSVKAYSYCDPSSKIPVNSELAVLSYNIKSGQASSLEQVIDTLREIPFDVVVLQEVDVHFQSLEDQARKIAQSLNLCGRFRAALNLRFLGRYGIAVLSKYPVESSDSIGLPMPRVSKLKEPRAGLRVSFLTEDWRKVHVITTHLSLAVEDRVTEVNLMMRKFQGLKGESVILAGDLNDVPDSPTALAFEKQADPGNLTLRPALREMGRAPIPTFSALNPAGPTAAIDLFFLGGAVKPKALDVFSSKASDHLPIRLTVQLKD
jgi:endonuclease/exonuclease/phosphatase family metal-dependent hydrolase